MFPCSQSHGVKEALFGVYHYNGALGEFHNQKGKKNHCWLQESIKLLSALSRLHEGGIFFFFIGQSSELKWAYGQIISTLINGPFMALPSKWWALRKEIVKPRTLWRSPSPEEIELLSKVGKDTTRHCSSFWLTSNETSFPGKFPGCYLVRHLRSFNRPAK